MLKWSSEEDINKFCATICSLFNPKFNGSKSEQDAQSELAFATVYSFAKNCELTANEFIIAFNLAAEGKLKTEEDKNGKSESIQLYREIDMIKLIEIKSAYIRHKANDKMYENGKAQIREFLTPTKVELSPEEKKKERARFYASDYARLQREGKVLGSTIFYDLIKKNGLEKINIDFVEKTLSGFKPETTEPNLLNRKEDFGQGKLPRIIKNDAKTFFIDAVVEKYFQVRKLKELTEEEFIKYWETIYEK